MPIFVCLFTSREVFDQHLDTILVDLENLREVLSLQGSPLDAATLLGVCDSLGWNLDSTIGVDPFSWPSNSASRSWAGKMSPLDSSPTYPLASLLDQQKTIQSKVAQGKSVPISLVPKGSLSAVPGQDPTTGKSAAQSCLSTFAETSFGLFQSKRAN